MYKMRVWIWTLGMLSTLAFLHVVLLGLFGSTHLTLDQPVHILLPGYHPGSVSGFVIGLVESFLWGAYVAILFVVIHNYFYGIHHIAPRDQTSRHAA